MKWYTEDDKIDMWNKMVDDFGSKINKLYIHKNNVVAQLNDGSYMMTSIECLPSDKVAIIRNEMIRENRDKILNKLLKK